MRRTPALILGGGPAGAAAAIMLARAGSPHLLVERSRETGDALCGGFLSWRTLSTLQRLGIDPDQLNLDNVTRVRLFTHNRMAEVRLPRAAKGVSRHRLDTMLLAEAARRGSIIERGVVAKSAADGVVSFGDGNDIAADALFLATGKYDLRGLARPAEARGADPSLGIRVRLGPAPGLTTLVGDAIELHMIDRGYAGLVMQEDGSCNLCMAVHRSRLNEAGDPEKLLITIGHEVPALGDRLAFRRADAPIDAIANVPYGWRLKTGTVGLFRLGDQAGVIPSLAGEGMGIAIASGVRAAQAYLAEGPGGAVRYQQRLASALARPIGLADIIRHAAESPRAAPYLLGLAGALPPLIALAARLTRIGHSPIDDASNQVKS
jgi:flavin-dependent dehydrogenase